MPSPRKYIFTIGDTVGELTIIGERLKRRPDGRNRRVLEVLCSCGTSKDVYPSNLISGDTQSCGCLQRKLASNANKRHGAKSKNASTDQKRLISIWKGMRSRCYNHHASNFKWYGAKGIKIEWSDFNDFYTWAMNNGYTKGLELDRINPSLNYSESNCVWSTKGDNIARAHLKIDETIKEKVTTIAMQNGLKFSEIVEDALRLYLDGREGVQ